VTLKELRISKGLNQAQCAEYLGMSTRNYQNYENDAAKANTARYHAIYQKLESYGQPVVTAAVPSQMLEFHTNVVTGAGLQALANSVAKYGKRDCFSTLQKFVNGSYDGKICILYGLRRTGKTTLLFQMLSELPIEKTAYIKVQTIDDMSRLTKDLKALFELGYRYVFIDEITLLSDFIDTAAVLSDVFSMMGMKIVVSGTDSLGFVMANRDELYDRSVTIHTSFIPFREYARLLNIRSVDSYIEYDVNEKQILERLKAIIEVKEKSETTVPITQEHIDKVKKYLLMLDLIVNCPERYESGKQAEHIVFSQPGMRYAIAKALVYSLMQDAYFASISEADKAYITGKILDDVKGRMLEDIVLLEVCKAAPSTMEAFKFKFDAGGEFDMVIYDKASKNCRIYEIKHSTEANEKQTLHLRDAEKCQIVEKRFGPISGKFVLYRGKDTFAEGVQYLNVENFLCGLK